MAPHQKENAAKFQTTSIAGLSSPSFSQEFAKRCLDLAVTIPALVLLSPILLLIAVAIRLDSSGSPIFKQYRHGQNHTPFTIYKFRTMRADAGNIKGGKQATKNDPRVTRLGAFLRKSSLDELPQLLNVLKGDMSLVGPRPHPIDLNEFYEPKITDYWRRHMVKPGLTGWAQVNGARGETPHISDMKRRVDFDLEYVKNQGLWLDVMVLIKTAFIVVFPTNAH